MYRPAVNRLFVLIWANFFFGPTFDLEKFAELTNPPLNLFLGVQLLELSVSEALKRSEVQKMGQIMTN